MRALVTTSVSTPTARPRVVASHKFAEALFRKLVEKSSALTEMRSLLEKQDRDWPTILKGIRRARGLKQAALGELLGVDQSRVSRWESGKECPNIGAQKALLELMNV